MKGSFLGPSFKNITIENELKRLNAVYIKYPEDKLIEKTATMIADGKAIGWFQGRMEFGPRSLGSRSIIADPRSEKMQKILNLKVKYRESFRPFAPSVLREEANKWFNIKCNSPYMLLVSNVKKDICDEMTDKEKNLFGIDKLNIKRSKIPAVTHVDYTARVQTVDNKTNPKFYSLISKFNELTGYPILVNTSFNIRGEPIVCDIKDAFKCFMGTHLDVLVIENYLLIKNNQKNEFVDNYKNQYDFD